MKLSRIVILAAFVGALVAPGIARPTSGQQAPPMPTPGPEHAVLKMDEGTWDATVEFMLPGAPPMTSKGVEVNKTGCGGLCLITDFNGELMPGMAFEGHGVVTWDAVKKKYMGSWTDSMSKGLSIVEATWDPAAKRMNASMEGPDMEGKITKTRSVTEYRDKSRLFSAFVPGPDGKEYQMLRITYTRRN